LSTLRFLEVSKTFVDGGPPVVDSCTFTVPAGALVALIGPSGCGKTTLLKMVNRLYEPSQGRIELDGVDIRTLEPTALRRQIGYVIQQVGLFPHLTVAQNIAVVPQLLGWSEDAIRARVNELLALVELPPEQYCSRYPAQLSGGQQQRVGVARALAGDPAVVLMDEPFGALDAMIRRALQDALQRLQQLLRKTILFVTHDVDEALRLADKIVVLRAGRVVQAATPYELLAHPADAFVRELLGADDMMRRLSLLRVAQVMTPLPSRAYMGDVPVITAQADLRVALSAMLQANVSALTVLGADGASQGRLTLEQLRGALHGEKSP